MDLKLDIEPYIKASSTHLSIRKDTPLPVFRALLTAIKELKPDVPGTGHTRRWIVGDAYNFARSKSFFASEGYSKYAFLSESGLSHDGARNAGRICARYSPSQRWSSISFTHHQRAATLPPKERHDALKEAERKSLTSGELKNLVALKKQIINQGEEVDTSNVKAAICPLCDGSGIVSRQRA